MALTAPASASVSQLSYAVAGHAIAAEMLKRGLPIVKRPPAIRCIKWQPARISASRMQGRIYSDDCKGNGYVLLVASRLNGKTAEGWTGPKCRTTGPIRKTGGTIDPACDLGAFPW